MQCNRCKVLSPFKFAQAIHAVYDCIIPNTAVFGPTNFIETTTTTTTTARMKILDEDF